MVWREGSCVSICLIGMRLIYLQITRFYGVLCILLYFLYCKSVFRISRVRTTVIRDFTEITP
jgi:Ca2+/Na+ antiporter